MEVVWHSCFNGLFNEFWFNYYHQWQLKPTRNPVDLNKNPEWSMFKDSAKVRFNCQRCGHGWTSMKGRVAFWFWLHPNGYQPLDCYGRPLHTGTVYFKLYGQKCQNCMDKKRFEAAMWYPEEVQKVLQNLHQRVGQIHYGFTQSVLRIDRRAGKPRQQHNSSLCQACQEGGICFEGIN